ncbi:MAG: Mth938-like domain-containing protein [Pseudolabrys sp.]|nr:Mth938-like domain-containing protein [Pseudolabrys sp.]
MAAGSDTPHLPRPAIIEAYGQGGFRFAGNAGNLSHRGSLLCLPDGVWAWPVTHREEVDGASLAQVFTRNDAIDIFLLGAGKDPWPLPEHLRHRFQDYGISADAMTTGAAVSTWNILLGEGRRVAAGLIAV